MDFIVYKFYELNGRLIALVKRVQNDVHNNVDLMFDAKWS